MAFQLKHECETCGHSIPLDLTYCGGEECLNRYAEDNELEGHPFADFEAWQRAATEAQAGADYHEWAVAHRDLDHLQSDKVGGVGEPHDAEQIAELREALHLGPAVTAAVETAAETENPIRYARDREHRDYAHADFLDWKATVPRGGPRLDYDHWVRAHQELTELQGNETINRHELDDIIALNQLLNGQPAGS